MMWRACVRVVVREMLYFASCCYLPTYLPTYFSQFLNNITLPTSASVLLRLAYTYLNPRKKG
jgi:hypothetical protein